MRETDKFSDSTKRAKRLRQSLSPRHRRLIVALLLGPLPREAADRVAGASNSPEYVRELRDKYHLNIHTERVEKIDRDGLKIAATLSRETGGQYHVGCYDSDRLGAFHFGQRELPFSKLFTAASLRH